jgi:sec-independent protein translocase protein TatB|tara:strand:+ start:762 stop:992 length:231 start_codon:yes stop_codon:yes gene_type:complete
MPQIGWFELLIIVIIAILVIGPKEFPIVLRKVGNWVGSIKKYFSEMQNSMSEITKIGDNISEEKNITDKDEKKDDE